MHADKPTLHERDSLTCQVSFVSKIVDNTTRVALQPATHGFISGCMNLAEFLRARRKEIETQIETLQVELAQIEASEKVVFKDAQVLSETVVVEASRLTSFPERASVRVRENSIKAWVLRALADKPSGLTTDAIIDAVRAIGGPDVPRNSMTPQLSRLKAQGFLALEGGRWKLAEFKTGAAFNPTNTSDAEDLIG